MQKIIIFILLSLLMATAVKSQETVTIKGNVTGDSKGYNKIYLYGLNIRPDSAVITNGMFSFSFVYVNGCTPRLYTQYEIKTTHGSNPFQAVINGPCNLYLKDVDITKGMSSGTWSGAVSAEEYQAFERGGDTVTAGIIKKMKEKYPGRDYRDSVYRKESEILFKEGMSAYVTTFVKAHPDSYASVVALNSQRTSVKNEELKKVFGILSKKQQATPPGENIAAYLAGLKNSVIGSKVSDFTVLSPEEKEFTFSSLKGKYVMIDFWASWCVPCKKSFPHMKEVYARYKGEKFEIFSISVDRDKEAWLKELKNQNLPWLQALDIKHISQSRFAVTAVPTTYLIGPDGKILMKEIGFDSSGKGPLEKKLNELFPKSSLVN